jgi:hypothetical protein
VQHVEREGLEPGLDLLDRLLDTVGRS